MMDDRGGIVAHLLTFAFVTVLFIAAFAGLWHALHAVNLMDSPDTECEDVTVNGDPELVALYATDNSEFFGSVEDGAMILYEDGRIEDTGPIGATTDYEVVYDTEDLYLMSDGEGYIMADLSDRTIHVGPANPDNRGEGFSMDARDEYQIGGTCEVTLA